MRALSRLLVLTAFLAAALPPAGAPACAGPSLAASHERGSAALPAPGEPEPDCADALPAVLAHAAPAVCGQGGGAAAVRDALARSLERASPASARAPPVLS